MITWNRACRGAQHFTLQPATNRRWLSQNSLEWLAARPIQSYISTSRDPYLNLSIEHYLLQKSAPDSTILLLYINRPSIIIGRNQNPWSEVNLALLDSARNARPETEPSGLGVVDLVRRRSGGGTVFHDEGNVNWTVICPPRTFTRDKHAEMVTRALRSCGVARAKVNERHDIVLDQGQTVADVDRANMHVTPYTHSSHPSRPLKVSGSAYKLTRQRALHHGTCLLSSPNLNVIPHYLHSPAKPYITARGVESVSSPVGNILLENEEFIAAVQKHFALMYTAGESIEALEVGDEWLENDTARKGYDELKSLDWTYLQTPQFTVSNASDIPATVDLDLTVRNGIVSAGTLARRGASETIDSRESVARPKLHEIESWPSGLQAMFPEVTNAERDRLAAWLKEVLPPSHVASSTV
ncbi:hypothetical protein LTR78_006301 [Recurvomyces mirabilis]|uniref:Putative lipoate-protein ligase A n=1 Tax=Recurvomyces mirabilis TaxID=574656 RepID=A0AAE1C075_9PEZI|nr:hypothetical protein LTR78_006301 [Recurvomyces mirabilis]KAK5152190.1 hypothetical protein LTS14_008565 [Recurvomyces mirabilis]